ncbi:energy-coupling factor transporter transmembrane component T family protein [Microbacterium maritypicum]|uniref:energy-coupling factor transporter transmembrane component T family protein n=1 Tax=Microbacterium TaxID=33882 RepID=UPI00049308DB|nr:MULTISPECIES: energy-coupling factor transporter transmembrane component T [Microbacterium]NIG65699.1 energy-coupling factor transporter transmembrane protein EcfT [Microbacterium sp. Be9]MCV0334226.1 energy-coupling factor transporter transmembrane protein EcfT [Microbacterium sp.]MCV0374246.1 energy-coupling factor transporter transmembrane protein EcfT [Microbacterium sp.]MCV0389318.1 energy-coupling factor transporter transmembrane protein EcfT [Microbacterium sp.]MCV0418852.1 energy-co
MTAVETARTVWLDGVNPVTKLVLAVLLSVPLFASIDVTSALAAIVLQLLCLPLTGLRLSTVLKRLLPIAIFAPIAGVSMLLYAEPAGRIYWTFGFATISEDSITLAIAVSLRVIALGLPTILLFGGTDPTELADALAQVAKLPSRFVLGILAGTRMLGLFLDDWRTMSLARRARGVGDRGVLRRFFSMAFVLLVFAVRRGSTLALAMEARGFGSGIPRTWSRPSRLHPRDAVALIGGIAIMALALAAAVLVGTFRFVWS